MLLKERTKKKIKVCIIMYNKKENRFPYMDNKFNNLVV